MYLLGSTTDDSAIFELGIIYTTNLCSNYLILGIRIVISVLSIGDYYEHKHLQNYGKQISGEWLKNDMVTCFNTATAILCVCRNEFALR